MPFTSEQYKRWDKFMAKMSAKYRRERRDDGDGDSLPDIEGDDICTICLAELIFDKKRLQCGHKFHRDCILEWAKNHNNCPMCRLKIMFLNIF